MRDTAGPVGQERVQKTVLLFDVDGTLLMGKNTHARVMKGALQEVLGRPITVMIGEMSGRTDRHIITNVLREMGYTSAEIAQRFDEIIEKMTEAFRRESLANYRLLPGVATLLDELAKRPDTVLGIVTGNPQKIARMKLARFDLNRYFVLGAFGEEHEERGGVVADALRQAREAYPIGRVFVVGDTVVDVEAARQNRVKIAAVATGPVRYSVLSKQKPDLLFRTLRRTRAVVTALCDS